MNTNEKTELLVTRRLVDGLAEALVTYNGSVDRASLIDGKRLKTLLLESQKELHRVNSHAELLEALKQLETFLSRPVGPVHEVAIDYLLKNAPEGIAYIQQARSAIARATGETI